MVDNSLFLTHPELVEQWHPVKNVNLSPLDVTAKSVKTAWWFLPYDDPKTGRHFDFEWEARICDRAVRPSRCPFLVDRAVWKGFNDFQTIHPNLAKEWHPTKNGDLTPSDVTAKSAKKVWWLLPYDDPDTGKHFDFEWMASVGCRATKGYGCPFLTGHAVFAGFNDLATVQPLVASQWHPTKNGELRPENVLSGSERKVWWFFSYDDPNTGKHFDFEWEASICDRTIQGQGCPFVTNRALWKGYNDLQTTHPNLAKEWHPTKNGRLTPSDVVAGSAKKVWWLLAYDDPNTGKHFDFEWKTEIRLRAVKENGCPFLATDGASVWSGFNDLATTHPEVAKLWHPTKNGRLTPFDVSAGSGRKVWWSLSLDSSNPKESNDLIWKASICNQVRSSGCPYLSGHGKFASCSHGEKHVSDFLEKRKIHFQSQKFFPDLVGKSGRVLRFDFLFELRNEVVVVEYQGRQHYNPVEYFGGEETFKKQFENDEIKRRYCKEHNIRLIEIPYTEDTYEKIEAFLDMRLASA